MKEFNLELAKQGHPVCTRNGRKVRILTFDRQCNTPIVALIDNTDEYNDPFEVVCSYHEDGKFEFQGTHPNDLMMASTKHEGWVNVYSDKGYHVDKEIWQFEENAIEIGKEFTDYVATVKIEWED